MNIKMFFLGGLLRNKVFNQIMFLGITAAFLVGGFFVPNLALAVSTFTATQTVANITAVSAVAQINTITIGGTIEVGDIFTATLPTDGAISFTAITTSTSDIATGLNNAILASTNYGTQAFTSGVVGSVITLTAKVAGTGFTVTSDTTSFGPDTTQSAISNISQANVVAVSAVAQVAIFTPELVAIGETFRATINGAIYDYTAVDTLAATVVAALAISMDLNADVACVDTTSTTITCTASVAGTSFTFSASFFSTMTGYNTALAAVTQANYTSATWTAYQLVVSANVVTDQNTQVEVDAATANITAAQGSLVTLATELAAAKVTAHTALTTARALYTDTNYTSANLIILNGFKTDGDTAINDATNLAGVSSAQNTAMTGMAGVAIITRGGGGGGFFSPQPISQVLGASIGPIAGCDIRTTGFSVTTGKSCVGNTGTTVVGKVLGAEKFIFTLFLKMGSKGNEVIELQKFLNTLGYTLTADGKFDAKSKAALIKFQLANKLKGDGIAGPKVRALLNK